MISCKIIYKRDPNTLKITDKIQAVKAPNGKRSLLFDAIRNQINDDTKALTQYFKVYTDEFKEGFGDWEQGLISDKLDQNNEPKYDEVKGLFIDEIVDNVEVTKPVLTKDKEEDIEQFSLSSSTPHQGQPTTKSETGSVAIDVDPFKSQLNDDGYSQDQIDIIETYNAATQSLTGKTVKVAVSELPTKLRKIFELKGEEFAEVYETIDETGKLGHVTYRVSNLQDLKKVQHQTKEKATAQEHSPKSIISRQRGTEMHDMQEQSLAYFATSNDPVFNPQSLRDMDVNLWAVDALEAYKLTDDYKALQEKGSEIFLTNQKTDPQQHSWMTHAGNLQVDKLAMSMLRLYHQVQMTQQAINKQTGKNQKPVFILEKPFLDKGQDVAGTMDIFVIFSDGTASIYDHKFTDLYAEKKYFKAPSTEQKAEIDRIREEQGLPVNSDANWYYQLPDNINLYKKEEAWNSQIGRYAQMAKQLYGVKSIRQARILPVATTYTKVDAGRKTKKGDTKMEAGPGSKVEVVLTGHGDLGVSQIALNIERTGDVNLDRFIDMLIKNKESLKKEMKDKHAWENPKYVDRIKLVDESIQALLKSRDITHISDAIAALAVQIEHDLENVEDPISFEQIIIHLNDIQMYNSFMELASDEINKLESEHKDLADNKENPYTTFKNRLSAANYELDMQAQAMHDKMTTMIVDVNKEGGFMSEKMFGTFSKQKDMNTLGVYFTHLRQSNHPIISLFSQLLDGIETNVMKERTLLKNKIDKANKSLTEWGKSKGLSGTKIYKDIIDPEYNNLIRKFTQYKTEVFPDYTDPKNHKKNIAWFKENFERIGVKDDIFQAKYKLIQEYYKRETKGDDALYKKKIGEWLDQNDVNHNGGDNKAWYNQYVQHWLTPKNPDAYYTDEYKNLLKSENKPLLNFYNLYTDQMNLLASRADFRIYENTIAEIRKDSIDTMVQDGMFLGGKQQFENIRNWWITNENDDGLQVIMNKDGLERKVPIFFQQKVGNNNKSLDLAKSLMLYSDFVNKYNGIKSIEHASLAMRELVAKTSGVKSKITGQILRDEAGSILMKEGAEAHNDKILSAFDTWIGYYIYGEKKKGDEKINKAVDAITSVSSRKAVALNLISALGGHVNAEAQLQMIAAKTTYFTTDTLTEARKKVKLGLKSLRASKEANEGMHSKVIFSSLFFEISQEDMSHELANSMSLSEIRSGRFGKQDYAYMLQRYSDDIIDNTTMTAMMMDYGIDPVSGKTYPLSKLRKLHKDNESEYKLGIRFKDIEFKSLWDMTIMKDGSIDIGNGKSVDIKLDNAPIILNQFTGKPIDSKTFTDFRRKGKEMIARAKGNMSNDDIAGYKTHAVGRLVMQFRGWLPATVYERFKGEQYNLTMEQMEVGRLIAVKNMVGKNLKRLSLEFVKELIPFAKGNFGDGKTMSDVLGQEAPLELRYKQFIADNPHLKPDPANPSLEQVTYEDYFNTHVSEVRALAKELQLYIALAIALGLVTMAGGDDELKVNPLLRGTTGLLERSMLEIGFFIPVAGASEQVQLFTRAPAASISLFTALYNTGTNTLTEGYDLLTGADWNKTNMPGLGAKPWTLNYKPRQDASPMGYYTTQWIPPIKFINTIIGFNNTTKRSDTWYDYWQEDWMQVGR